jgi:hypothetical protein
VCHELRRKLERRVRHGRREFERDVDDRGRDEHLGRGGRPRFGRRHDDFGRRDHDRLRR